ncbi:MAG TPA: DUF4388 domain-containing protein, partial [Anaeromyxobacteraceae bacterium]
PWAALRRALVRGQLAEATACQRELGAAPPAAGSVPGAEPLPPAERERVLAVLLEGIGNALSGDAVGGARKLQELARPAQANLSIRWLAHLWTGRAALQGGSLETARQHVKEALTLARQLDEEARAVSQWTAGELLALSNDASQGLPWLREARAVLGRLGERWSVARTWLVEARIRASSKDEEGCAAAARQALEADPGWEEPTLFLARRALLRGDVATAEQLLQPVRSAAADRARALLDAVRAGKLAQAEVSEFLREQEGPPTPRSLRALERIANAAPAFAQAREALAWMLLRRGKYPEASVIFRALASQALTPAERASVEAGLACVTRALPPESPPSLVRSAPQPGSASPNPTPTPALALTPTPVPIPPPGPTPTPRPGASGVSSSVFSGRLSVFALPDLLEFLRAGRRSGLLVCSSAAGLGSLRFRAGRITAASSPAAPRLGQLLVQERKITPLTLRAVASGDEDSDDVVGERLVREGAVPVAAVEDALRRGIELAMRELVGWKEGEFAFDGADVSPAARPAVELDPQGLLLNLFKELDESSRPPVVHLS